MCGPRDDRAICELCQQLQLRSCTGLRTRMRTIWGPEVRTPSLRFAVWQPQAAVAAMQIELDAGLLSLVPCLIEFFI